MLRYENIEVKFGDFIAIPNMNLEIKEGDFFTFLGPSGCGKTTALRTLAGLKDPSKGKIYIAGKDVTNLPSDKRSLGMVFQNYALFPTMTVYENIAYGLKIQKFSKEEIDKKVKAIAKEVNLTEEQLSKNVSNLSGGQQQRVAIARALVLKPKILLLDEPLSNLDAKLRHSLRIQLKELQRHFGITSVYVTHDQEEALTMSDQIAVMKDGVIQQLGTPREVYSRSRNEFVCNFLGEANKLNTDDLISRNIIDFLEEGDATYVRVEKVFISSPSNPRAIRENEVMIPAVVTGHSYQGTVTVYETDAGDYGQMKVVLKENELNIFEVGDEVTLSIPIHHILVYDKDTRELKNRD